MLLVISVKVRRMVRGLNLDEHSNDDSKESTELRHKRIVLTCLRSRKNSRGNSYCVNQWGLAWLLT